MILSALLAVAVVSSSVEDYYPLTTGTKWTYEDDSGRQMMQEVGEPVDTGKGVMATPITASVQGRNGGAMLYRVDGDTLLLVGYTEVSANKPTINLLTPAQPILRASAGKAEWKYNSEVPTGLGPVLQQVRGDSNKGGKRKILDREVETLIVHVFARIGNERNHPVEIRQDMVYGKGIGLLETTEVTKAGGKTVKKVLKLVKFEPAQG